MHASNFAIEPGEKNKMRDFDAASTGGYKNKDQAQQKLEKDIEKLAELQDVFYAARSHALLVIFQAMDTAGKDGAIKHVMSGVNPQGVQVTSFKQPSSEELAHDYLWRANKALPPRGMIGIFNRSYYEEVLVVRVHAQALAAEGVALSGAAARALWKDRYDDINHFERHLTRNGTVILKFMLNLSKEEQKRRLLARLDAPEKNWKFSAADLKERGYWKQYMESYEEMLSATSTPWAPWYVIPADHKWFTRLAVADAIAAQMKALKLSYPKVSKQQQAALAEARKLLAKNSG